MLNKNNWPTKGKNNSNVSEDCKKSNYEIQGDEDTVHGLTHWFPENKRQIRSFHSSVLSQRILSFDFVDSGHLNFCMTFDLEEEPYICYAVWVPYEVYVKDFSKFHCFHPVLSSWCSSIHLLELKIEMWRIPPCHTSKVASWHVDCRYELHFWSYLGKILSKSPKTVKIWHYCSNHNFLHVFQLLLNILPR